MQNHRWGRMFARSLLAVSAVVCSSLALGDTEKTYDYVSKVQVGEDSFFGVTPSSADGQYQVSVTLRMDDKAPARVKVLVASVMQPKAV